MVLQQRFFPLVPAMKDDLCLLDLPQLILLWIQLDLRVELLDLGGTQVFGLIHPGSFALPSELVAVRLVDIP